MKEKSADESHRMLAIARCRTFCLPIYFCIYSFLILIVSIFYFFIFLFFIFIFDLFYFCFIFIFYFVWF
jgi:hypothetical protein